METNDQDNEQMETNGQDNERDNNAPIIFYQNSLRILLARRFDIEASKGIGAFNRSGEEILYEDVIVLVEAFQKFLQDVIIKKQVLQNIANNLDIARNPLNGINLELVRNIDILCQEIKSIPHHNNAIFYREKMEYSLCLGRYWQCMLKKKEIVKSKRTKQTSTKTKIDQAEKMLRKLNLTRLIKRVMIGLFFSDHEAHPEINSYRTTLNRDLHLKDFIDSWHVGFEPADAIDE